MCSGTQSPIDLLQEVKQEEEITSSVKDDVSSPVEPLSQASLVEDSQKEDIVEVSNPVEVTEVQPQAVDILSDLACPLPTSQPLIQPDVVSTLELSSPGEQLTLNGLEPVSIYNYFIRLRKVIKCCQVPVENNEQICIMTDNIKPEYPESEILSPSEESRDLDEPNAPSPLPVQTEIPVDVIQETLPVQSEPEPTVEPTLEIQSQLEPEPVVAEPLSVEPVSEPVLSPTPEVQSELESVPVQSELEPTLPVQSEPVSAQLEAEPVILQSESEPVVSSTITEQAEPEPITVSASEPVVATVPEIEVAKLVETIVPPIKSEVVSSTAEVPFKQSKPTEKDKKKPIGKSSLCANITKAINEVIKVK